MAGVTADRADDLRHAFDAERIGKLHDVLDVMDIRRHRRAAMKQRALEPAAELRSVHRGKAGVLSSGKDREQRRPVAGLGRDREVVALEQPQREPERLPARHDDDPVDIRIALDDLPGAGQHQHVDRGARPRPPQAANQRGRQQQVADPAQRYHQDARPFGQGDGSVDGKCHGAVLF